MKYYTMTYLESGVNSEFLMFGVSKESHTDWSMNLKDGRIHNNEPNQEGTSYGLRSLKDTIIECIVDWLWGTVTFIQNGRNMGVAFTDENIASGPLYFAISMDCNDVSRIEILETESNNIDLKSDIAAVVKK